MVSSSVYVGNYNGTVSVVDIATNTISTTISGFDRPYSIAITPNGEYAYVGNYAEGTISVINTETNTISTTITGFSNPYFSVITPNGDYAYVTNNSGNSVFVIDISTNIVKTKIDGFISPYGIAITLNGNYLYVANNGGTTVSVISTETNTISTTITGFSSPSGIAITPNGDYAGVADENSGKVSVIDISTNTITRTVPYENQGELVGIVMSPNDDYAYATIYDSSYVVQINITKSAINGNFIGTANNPYGIAITPNEDYLYVANSGGTTVSIIDISTNTVTGTISGFPSPFSIAITPKSSTPSPSTTIFYSTSSAKFSISQLLVNFKENIYGNNKISLGEENYFGWALSGENTFSLKEGEFSFAGNFNSEIPIKVNELASLFTGDFNAENNLTLIEKTNYRGKFFAENSVHLQTIYASLMETIFLNGITLTESNIVLGEFEESAFVNLNALFEQAGQKFLSASSEITLNSVIEKVNLTVLEKVKMILGERVNSSLTVAEVTEKLKFVFNEYTLIKLLEESNFKFTEFTSYITELVYEVLESINLESYISSGKFDFVKTQTLSFLGTTAIGSIFKELTTVGFSLHAFTTVAKSYVLTATFPPFISTTSFTSSWSNVVDMVGKVLRSLGFPVVYYSDVKNIQVDTQNLMGAYVMTGAEPVLYWHNWANMYVFKLRLYEMGLPNSFTKYDDAIQQKMMYKVIGQSLKDGGVVIGYNAVSNIKPMVRERGITLIEYTLRILVLY